MTWIKKRERGLWWAALLILAVISLTRNPSCNVSIPIWMYVICGALLVWMVVLLVRTNRVLRALRTLKKED